MKATMVGGLLVALGAISFWVLVAVTVITSIQARDFVWTAGSWWWGGATVAAIALGYVLAFGGILTEADGVRPRRRRR